MIKVNSPRKFDDVSKRNSPVKDELNENADTENYVSSCSDIWKVFPCEGSARDM